jgi:serine/threonine protein kinase
MTTNRAGSLYWMAPELLDPDCLENKFRTPASDVYAFGCVCLEVLADLSLYITALNFFSYIQDDLHLRICPNPGQ